MAQPILTQQAQWPDRVREVQSTIAKDQTSQGSPTARQYWGPTAEADRGRGAHAPG